MGLNPLAEQANAAIRADCPQVYEQLSELGRALYFPRGILTQSAEAKERAHRYNATIGIATEAGHAMYLDCVHQHFDGLEPDDCYPYAPSTGLPALRAAWQAKQHEETPSLAGASTSLPVVTNALTHGLTVAGELFIDRGDEVLLPDQMWGNYRLGWGVRMGARLSTFSFFTEDLSGFNQSAFDEALAERQGRKLIVVLNFPNNPTGYSLTRREAAAVVASLERAAEAGTRLVVICDDAYYGMFYHEDCETESLVGRLAQAHENLLAVKVDGATKEIFVWGLRIGFITFGVKGGSKDCYAALEQKCGGAIRGSISNVNKPGQSIALAALGHPDFRAQQAEKVAVLRARAEAVRTVVNDPRYADCWDVYPFNAGYFMCLRVKDVDANELREHLLDEHGLGTISLTSTDLRVAFSCVERDEIPELFDRIAQGVRSLRD